MPGGSSVLPLALRPPRSGRLWPPPCSMALRARSTAHRADDQESCRRSTVDRPDRCFHLNRWLLADPRRHLEADPTATLQYPTLKELSIIDRLGICPRLSPDCPPALRISALLQGSLMDTYGNINKLCAGSCS
ncbi:uncharacterized protein LOC120703473 [Panicum virgatum]|uniref:uncharacterized protein LOC120703473 n=1 Tax=Panicum virgatum TaxID=38727 RepID=UPI0019D54D2B|nr:uncharacterized protein LOC120703473 [Panicum virgatum]